MPDPHAVLNALPTEKARAALARCCGSARWVAGMLARRPFPSMAALHADAEATWTGLGRDDVLEAFAHHPRIGARGDEADDAGHQADDAWAREEQARVVDADAETRRSLADANERYVRRFGYIFIVCATGKSAAEMLGLLEERLGNDPARELAIAAGEPARITPPASREARRHEPAHLSRPRPLARTAGARLGAAPRGAGGRELAAARRERHRRRRPRRRSAGRLTARITHLPP